jgi:hypothetical protein
MAATSEKELLCTLTNTNSTLTSQLATKDKVIASLQAQLRNNNNTNNAQTPAPAPGHRQVAASDKTQTLLLDAWRASLQQPHQHQLS